MRRFATRALLSITGLFVTVAGCGGSATTNDGTGGQSNVTGGQATTGGWEATGGFLATGGRTATGGQATGGQSQGGSAGESPDICSLPQQTGPCTALVPSFWHNPKTNECEPFIYGGCNGTANRFRTLAECLGACGGKPSTNACDRAINCSLTSPSCCGACEPLEITDLVAINTTHVGDRICDVACGACPPLGANQMPTRDYFVPGCVQNQCTVVDVRETPVTACQVDSDCTLRLGAHCCQACSGEPIAVNKNTDFCPDGALPCPTCVGKIPPGYSTSCVSGRCQLMEPPCTLSHPCP